MSSMLNDLFTKIIDIQTKTLKKVQQLSSGSLSEQAAVTYGIQKAQVITTGSGSSIKFKNNISIYKVITMETDSAAGEIYTLDLSELNPNQAYVFEVWLYLSNPCSITFESASGSINWLNESALSDASEIGLYCFVFRVMPDTFAQYDGSSIIFDTSYKIIGNLAYSLNNPAGIE